jgi:hypothetical protein
MDNLLALEISLLAFAVAGIVLAVESGLITLSNRNTDGSKRPSHTLRLIGSMLLVSLMGWAFVPPALNGLDPWTKWRPLIYAVSGAIAGLCVELFRRFINVGDRS